MLTYYVELENCIIILFFRVNLKKSLDKTEDKQTRFLVYLQCQNCIYLNFRRFVSWAIFVLLMERHP